VKRKKKKDVRKPGPKAVRLAIDGNWKDAMTASVVMGVPLSTPRKRLVKK
jgi:hypothetical protein